MAVLCNYPLLFRQPVANNNTGWNLIAYTGTSSSDSNSSNTAAINTTGASIIIISTADVVTATATPTDNKGNSYTLIRSDTAPAIPARIKTYVNYNPIVGVGHTFSYYSSGGEPGIAVQAWFGSTGSPALDQQTGTFSNTVKTSASASSITPTFNNELIVTSICPWNTNLAPVLTASYSITYTAPRVNVNSVGIGMAYITQSTAAATKPSWTFSSTGWAMNVVSFERGF
jgi:hypothetical protein